MLGAAVSSLPDTLVTRIRSSKHRCPSALPAGECESLGTDWNLKQAEQTAISSN